MGDGYWWELIVLGMVGNDGDGHTILGGISYIDAGWASSVGTSCSHGRAVYCVGTGSTRGIFGFETAMKLCFG